MVGETELVVYSLRRTPSGGPNPAEPMAIPPPVAPPPLEVGRLRFRPLPRRDSMFILVNYVRSVSGYHWKQLPDSD